ncbi:MAG: hypothetical protein ACYDCO_02025 [Armatimonadota bacterium]
MQRLTLLASLFLCLGALAGPVSILANGGKQELVPLAAVAELLDGTVDGEETNCCMFSARGKTLVLGATDIGFALQGSAEYFTNWHIDSTPDHRVHGVAVVFDGELYADKTLFIKAFGLQSATDFNHTLTDPQSGNKLVVPVGAVIPDLFGPSLISGTGILINGEPYVQVAGLATALAGGVNVEAGTGRMLATVNGHVATFAPYSTVVERDYQPQTLARQSVVYEDKLYVPAADFARLFELRLRQPSKEETARLFYRKEWTSTEVLAQIIDHPTLEVPVYLATFLHYQIASISADFDGDKANETAYAVTQMQSHQPGSVWIQKGAKTVWKLRLPEQSFQVDHFHARDLTGDKVPELVFGTAFMGAYIGALGITAYRWDPERKIYSNVLGSGTMDGFLTYVGSGGNGGIVFQPAANGKPPMLIRYETVEWRQSPQHYKATWFAWNGKFFVYRSTKTTKKAYDIFDDKFNIQQVFAELGVTGISLMRGFEE